MPAGGQSEVLMMPNVWRVQHHVGLLAAGVRVTQKATDANSAIESYAGPVAAPVPYVKLPAGPNPYPVCSLVPSTYMHASTPRRKEGRNYIIPAV